VEVPAVAVAVAYAEVDSAARRTSPTTVEGVRMDSKALELSLLAAAAVAVVVFAACIGLPSYRL